MSSTSRKTEERAKLIQEKCQTLLTQMLRDEDNKYCVDCDAKGPRWASWNLGVFLCIRCAGIHRNLGVHISRVKSVNLDSWTPEQVVSLQQMGNSRARAVYEAQLPDGFRRPQTDTALESFIRAKYEQKKYLAREWVQPPPPKVDWGKEIDEELEKQKRKKKAAQAGNSIGMGVLSGGEKKLSSNSGKSAPLPAPLPKPKPGQSGSSPKTHRNSTNSTGGGESNNQSNDLLGLSSPTKPVQDPHNDSFSNFLSATVIPTQEKVSLDSNPANAQKSTHNSLAKEEEDFFNQGSLGIGNAEKDKSGKLTKDSILALYGNAPINPVGPQNPHNPQMNYGQSQPMFGTTGTFTGMAPGYMNTGPHPQQHQFMTPPNSTSMYNAPVMTAPTAFSTPGLGMHVGGVGGVGGVGFGGGQFPVQGMNTTGTSGFSQQLPPGMGVMMPMGSGGNSGGGIMATGQVMQPANMNLMQTNQSLLGGVTMMGAGAPMTSQQQISQMSTPTQMIGMPSLGTGNMMPNAGLFPTQNTAAAAAAAAGSATSTASLNQQFGNLSIGNVWQ